MAILFETDPLLGVRLTPSSKDLLRDIRQAMEVYYFFKHADLPEPVVVPEISQAATGLSQGDLVSYTPDPTKPYPPRPWPWPFPWWNRNYLDQLVNIADGPVHDLGQAFGDPSPQPSIVEQIGSNAFHLKAATEALEKMDKARDQLKRNIAQLQKMK